MRSHIIAIRKVNAVKYFNADSEIMLHQVHCVCKHAAWGTQMSFRVTFISSRTVGITHAKQSCPWIGSIHGLHWIESETHFHKM